MRAVEIPAPVLEAIAGHARATYPDECCGFLVARPETDDLDAPRTIVRALPAPNTFEGERRRRFLVGAEELRDAEQRLEDTGEVVAGFYHSHPDHPARPSLFDQDHAWPWYSYLVTNVTSAHVGETRAFELDPETSEFAEVPMRRLSADGSTMAGR